MPALGTTKLKNSSFSKPQLGLFSIVFAIIGAYVLVTSFAASNPNLMGDLNNDNKVDALDLSLVLSNFNATTTNGDANSDGKVNILDLSIVLSHYGQTASSGYTIPSNIA